MSFVTLRVLFFACALVQKFSTRKTQSSRSRRPHGAPWRPLPSVCLIFLGCLLGPILLRGDGGSGGRGQFEREDSIAGAA